MTAMQVFASGSLPPDWVEALEYQEFGSSWGKMGEFEILCLMDECAFARWRTIPKSSEAELLRIAVIQTQRRSGVAKRLMSECLNYLAANGYVSLHLEVRASNISAQKLYESMGWQQISLRRAYYSDGEDAFAFVYSGSTCCS
ncbi:MAG: GNAT family N-acetyltransferase [Holophagales bacterium]|jgi:ribosomal protein S18 acetylase RimI-like enzyme|nr:GNAT family N-acetyltransferase [Holophagales bacterium]